jgi:hypothetical protein
MFYRHMVCSCRAYQQAVKYGNLTAQKLLSCLLQRPNASQALTRALTDGFKLLVTDNDLGTYIYPLAERYFALVDGLVINSEFDQWPVQRR